MSEQELFRFDIRWTATGLETIGNPNGKFVEYDAHNAVLAAARTVAYEEGKQDAIKFAQKHCYRPS